MNYEVPSGGTHKVTSEQLLNLHVKGTKKYMKLSKVMTTSFNRCTLNGGHKKTDMLAGHYDFMLLLAGNNCLLLEEIN